MKAKSRRKTTGPQPYFYYFRIDGWYASCDTKHEWKVVRERDPDASPWDDGEIREYEIASRHYLKLIAELLNPVKMVLNGEIDVCTSREVEIMTSSYSKKIQYEKRPQDEGGGSLWSRWNESHSHRVTTGLTYVDECSFLALLQVLSADRPVILELDGEEYYRNCARIRRVGWFTADDPERMEEVECAIDEVG